MHPDGAFLVGGIWASSGKCAAALLDGGVCRLAACRGLRWAILMCRSGSRCVRCHPDFRAKSGGASLVGGVGDIRQMRSGLAGRGLYVAWPRAAASDGQFSCAGRGARRFRRHHGFCAKSGVAACPWLAGFGVVRQMGSGLDGRGCRSLGCATQVFAPSSPLPWFLRVVSAARRILTASSLPLTACAARSTALAGCFSGSCNAGA